MAVLGLRASSCSARQGCSHRRRQRFQVTSHYGTPVANAEWILHHGVCGGWRTADGSLRIKGACFTANRQTLVHVLGEECRSIVPVISNPHHRPAEELSLNLHLQPKCPQRRDKQTAGRGRVFFHQLRYRGSRRAGLTALRRREAVSNTGCSAVSLHGLSAGVRTARRRKKDAHAQNQEKSFHHLERLLLTEVAHRL